MARKLALCVLTTALLFSLVGCGGGEPEAKDESSKPVKIGAVLSLTGTYAAMGESEKQALELEAKRINNAGGVNGAPIEIIIEDDGTDEAKAVAAASKLIEQDGVVALIAATGTGQTMAIRGDVQRAGIAQVSMAGGTAVTAEFDKHVFQTPWSNTIVVPFVLNAVKEAGLAKVALISDSGGYGKDGRAVILAEAEKAGITLVADETFNAGDTDMTAQLTNIKKADADAILLWTAGKEAATIVKSARELGLEQPLFGGSGQARMEFIEGSAEAAEGFTFGTGKSLIPANWGDDTEQFAVVDDFAKRYETAYGEAPDIFAGHAFDAITLVADALTRAGADAGPSEIRDAVEQSSGVVGFDGTFTFSSTDHNGLTADDLALYRVEEGQWVPAK